MSFLIARGHYCETGLHGLFACQGCHRTHYYCLLVLAELMHHSLLNVFMCLIKIH